MGHNRAYEPEPPVPGLEQFFLTPFLPDDITEVDVDGTAVTGDPKYVDAPDDFALNTGSSCIDTGLPCVMPVGGTGFNSMGALIPD